MQASSIHRFDSAVLEYKTTGQPAGSNNPREAFYGKFSVTAGAESNKKMGRTIP